MSQPQTTTSFNDNIDQQIILDSDRRFTSITSQPPQISNNQNSPSPNNPQNKSNSIYMSKKQFKSTNNLLPNSNNYNLKNAGHPIACIATILFKSLSLFIYLFMGLFLSNVIIFIFVLIISALDFWTVKNVTGRLLVGLRWWSQYDEKGQQIWKFQSYDKLYESDMVDKTFFWSGQIISTVIWAIFLLIKILSLSIFWSLLTGINFFLCGINLYGYYKCRDDYKSKLKSLQSEGLSKLAGRFLFS